MHGSFMDRPGLTRFYCLRQVAARAQRASVEPSEIVRYEQYDAKHGARYVAHDASQAPMDEDDW